MKATFYPKGISPTRRDELKNDRSRITVQLRVYNENGGYDRERGNATETIWVKGIPLENVNEIIKAGLIVQGYDFEMES